MKRSTMRAIKPLLPQARWRLNTVQRYSTPLSSFRSSFTIRTTTRPFVLAFYHSSCPKASDKSLLLNPYIPIEEETVAGYHFNDFYHLNPGETFEGRYKALWKIRWGDNSTVWLAQDLATSYVSIFP